MSCKILVKIGPVVSAENRQIGLDGNCVACSRRGSAYWLYPDVLDGFSQSFHHMKALYVPMMDLYFIFQFVKGHYHGNQIMLP